VPELEEQETRLKATGFFRLLGPKPEIPDSAAAAPITHQPKLLLVDHDDCFIHTLANYARQTGASVVTYRTGFPLDLLDEVQPDMILISPGPGRPSDFGINALVHKAIELGIPLFGVCLGLQGIVEAFGGELGVLDYPVHGKPSRIINNGQGIFEGLPKEFAVGRYHSLYALRDKLPACLEITAESDDGVIMGVRHKTLPIEAVQFHPESILSAAGEHGLKLMRNALRTANRPVSV
jgi:anthranilate synthase